MRPATRVRSPPVSRRDGSFSLLASGMCLVDTPGLGSVFQHNTDETRAFVPHVDAALVVLGIDPPITADELGLVLEVSRQVDQLIFEISATERLLSGPTRDWISLEQRLRELASPTSTVVDHAARRGIVRLGARLLRELAEQHGALTRPLEASERRIAALDSSIQRATQLLQDLAALLRSEEQRMISQFFDTTQESFVSSSTCDLSAEVRRTVEGLASTHRGSALRSASADLEQQSGDLRPP